MVFITNTNINSPLEQFDVLNLEIFNYAPFFSTTNLEFFLLFAFLIIILGFHNNFQNIFWIPKKADRFSYVLELVYQEIIVLVFRNVGFTVGQVYFPLLTFIFLVIASLNLMGIIPFTFTVTSHITITFLFSFMIFVSINVRAILDKEVTFMGLFLPTGAPLVIAPFLICIEFISYMARVFSLAIRLFANIMAGHTLLKILIGFSFTMVIQNLTGNWPLLLLAVIPFILVFIITFLEVAIALLQGYVFTVLLCLYIKDLHTKH